MDRREALKRLAIGGALAAGGSVVLSSNNVAFAASGQYIGDTGLLAATLPGPGAPLPIAFTVPSSNGKTVLIGDSTRPQCDSGTPTVWYGWRINSYSLSPPGKGVLEIRTTGNGLITNRVSNSYTPGRTGNRTVKLTRSSGTPMKKDSYSVSVMVTWQCQHSQSWLEAEYTFVGAGTGVPSVENIAWNVV